jgi:hypothetical protein
MTPPDFISEPIIPDPASFDPAAMSRGEPGLPSRFTWRGHTYTIATIVKAWKSTGTDRGEVYLRRHWYTVRTADGHEMTLYCERQTKDRAHPKRRWWLFSRTTPP